jgi:hypothetical protein
VEGPGGECPRSKGPWCGETRDGFGTSVLTWINGVGYVPSMWDKHEFVFEFDKAYTGQLIEKFEASPQHSLTIDVAPPRKGVYALYHRGKLVHAGKALVTTLKRRLNEHATGQQPCDLR